MWMETEREKGSTEKKWNKSKLRTEWLSDYEYDDDILFNAKLFIIYKLVCSE